MEEVMNSFNLSVEFVGEQLSKIGLDVSPRTAYYITIAFYIILLFIILKLLQRFISKSSGIIGKKNKHVILIVGPNNSGKTALLYQLCTNNFQESVSSLELNETKILLPYTREGVEEPQGGAERKSFDLVDVPGHNHFRTYITQKLPECKCIILLLDSKDKVKIAEGADLLYDLLNAQDVNKDMVPILIACNKQDLLFARKIPTIKNDIATEVEQKKKSVRATMDETSVPGALETDMKTFEFSGWSSPIDFCECSVINGEINDIRQFMDNSSLQLMFNQIPFQIYTPLSGYLLIINKMFRLRHLNRLFLTLKIWNIVPPPPTISKFPSLFPKIYYSMITSSQEENNLIKESERLEFFGIKHEKALPVNSEELNQYLNLLDCDQIETLRIFQKCSDIFNGEAYVRFFRKCLTMAFSQKLIKEKKAMDIKDLIKNSNFIQAQQTIIKEIETGNISDKEIVFILGYMSRFLPEIRSELQKTGIDILTNNLKFEELDLYTIIELLPFLKHKTIWENNKEDFILERITHVVKRIQFFGLHTLNVSSLNEIMTLFWNEKIIDETDIMTRMEPHYISRHASIISIGKVIGHYLKCQKGSQIFIQFLFNKFLTNIKNTKQKDLNLILSGIMDCKDKRILDLINCENSINEIMKQTFKNAKNNYDFHVDLCSHALQYFRIGNEIFYDILLTELLRHLRISGYNSQTNKNIHTLHCICERGKYSKNLHIATLQYLQNKLRTEGRHSDNIAPIGLISKEERKLLLENVEENPIVDVTGTEIINSGNEIDLLSLTKGFELNIKLIWSLTILTYLKHKHSNFKEYTKIENEVWFDLVDSFNSYTELILRTEVPSIEVRENLYYQILQVKSFLRINLAHLNLSLKLPSNIKLKNEDNMSFLKHSSFQTEFQNKIKEFQEKYKEILVEGEVFDEYESDFGIREENSNEIQYFVNGGNKIFVDILTDNAYSMLRREHLNHMGVIYKELNSFAQISEDLV